ncbi:MAG: type 1 glutamine amidotransferase [Acidimicrobiales bacterium]|nr:type 1 glutamine amidotransferase [Acidimicrobiales bacterium]
MPERLRVGLLLAGYMPDEVARDNGTYPELFTAMLEPFGIDLLTYDLQNDGAPTDLDGADRHDGWVISGSANSAYEDAQWIRDLEDLCRRLLDRKVPLVGICFGHQVLAQAAGGQVQRADVGWGIGVHDYHLTGPRPGWVSEPAPDPVRVVASHQDQVVEVPDGAEVFLTSEFCPNAGLVYGTNAFSVQPHPEFTTGVSAGLLALRRDRIGAELTDEAATTLSHELDSPAVAAWIAAFLHGRTGL